MIYMIFMFMGKRYLIGPETRIDLYLNMEVDVTKFQSPVKQDIGFMSVGFGWVFDRLYTSGFNASWWKPNLVIKDTIRNRDVPLNVFQLGLEMGIIPFSSFVVHPVIYAEGGIGFTSDARDGTGYEDIFVHFTPSLSLEMNITPNMKMGIRGGYTYVMDLNPENTDMGSIQGSRWGMFLKFSGY